MGHFPKVSPGRGGGGGNQKTNAQQMPGEWGMIALGIVRDITPRSSDYHVTSPHNVHTLSSRQVMRIDKLISQKA